MKSAGQLAECKQPTITIRHLVNNTDRDKLQNCYCLYFNNLFTLNMESTFSKMGGICTFDLTFHSYLLSKKLIISVNVTHM